MSRRGSMLSALMGFYELNYALLDELYVYAQDEALVMRLPDKGGVTSLKFCAQGPYTRMVDVVRTPLEETEPPSQSFHFLMLSALEMRVAEVVRFQGCRGVLPWDTAGQARDGLLSDDRYQRNRFAAEWLAFCLKLLIRDGTSRILAGLGSDASGLEDD